MENQVLQRVLSIASNGLNAGIIFDFGERSINSDEINNNNNNNNNSTIPVEELVKAIKLLHVTDGHVMEAATSIIKYVEASTHLLSYSKLLFHLNPIIHNFHFYILMQRILDFEGTTSGSLKQIPYIQKEGAIYANLTIHFPSQLEEGWYDLTLYNCPPSDVHSMTKQASVVSVTLNILESNPNSYLPAGQESLPTLYMVLCCTYLVLSMSWLVYLRTSKHCVYCIHYLMLTVVLIKALSLTFHGINYYVIGKHGVPEEAWAVMYYITHIIRGALLFITILLIGAGWTFIKRMLTPRERNVFLIVVPLQILANVATIVIEESDAGTERYAVWKDIFIFLDIACCGAILFPVVWSIRHLQAASQIDGKAAINLRNLRLFRHFYILVICYVYFTRIVAYLLTITVPYQYVWVVELFKESVTIAFFVAVGFKFRPTGDNPYLLMPETDDDDEEETVMERIQLEDVWSQSGLTDGVTRVQRHHNQHVSANLEGGVNNSAFSESRTIDEFEV